MSSLHIAPIDLFPIHYAVKEFEIAILCVSICTGRLTAPTNTLGLRLAYIICYHTQ